MKKSVQILIMAVLACSLTAGLAFADPRGGVPTPAEDSMCHTIGGKANGICVAYCEAQDCDENPDQPACETLKNNWKKLTANENLPSLCGGQEQSLCPCFDKAMMLEQFGLVADPSTESCELFETNFSKLGTRGLVTQVSKVNHASSKAFNAQDWPEIYKDFQFCETYENGVRVGILEVVDEEVMAACVAEVEAVAAALSVSCQ